MRTYVAARRVRILAVTPLLGAVLAGVVPSGPAVAGARLAGPISRLASVSGEGILFGVAATSTRSAWAVGLTGRVGKPTTLIERWAGGAWKRVPSPAGASGGLLDAVAVTSARGAWAAGQTGSLFSSKPATLIERWNGTAWRRVPSPNPVRGGTLYGLAATSARSAWAVGQTGGVFNQRPRTLILRWNGTAWKRVQSPNAATPGSWLGAVAETSARSAWAVGCACNGPSPKTLIEQWNGTRWRLVPSPNPATGDNVLYGVAVISAHSAWAVGCTDCLGVKPKTLILRWNGTAWKRVPSPNPAPGGTLASVAVTSARNVWAVGFAGDPNHPGPKPVIERWNGTRWKLVRSPSLAGGATSRPAALLGVAAASARSAWAVGLSGRIFRIAKPTTVALHWNGTTWK